MLSTWLNLHCPFFATGPFLFLPLSFSLLRVFYFIDRFTSFAYGNLFVFIFYPSQVIALNSFSSFLFPPKPFFFFSDFDLFFFLPSLLCIFCGFLLCFQPFGHGSTTLFSFHLGHSLFCLSLKPNSVPSGL